MFFGGLNYDTTDQSLTDYLSERWSIEEVRVKFDMDGRSRGFAFASFRSTELLDSCFDAQPHTIDGKQVELRKVPPDGSGNWGGTSTTPAGAKSGGTTRYGSGGSSSTRVYIGSAPSDTSKTRGLTEEIEDDDIKDYFNRYGTVVGIAQHRWEDSNRKKGYGYIEFSDWDGAQAAMGIHHVKGKALKVNSYTQGGMRGVMEGRGAAPLG